jgi:hypothetical protein
LDFLRKSLLTFRLPVIVIATTNTILLSCDRTKKGTNTVLLEVSSLIYAHLR